MTDILAFRLISQERFKSRIGLIDTTYRKDICVSGTDMKVITSPQLIGCDDTGTRLIRDISQILLQSEIGIRGNIELGHQISEIRINEGQNTTGSCYSL